MKMMTKLLNRKYGEESQNLDQKEKWNVQVKIAEAHMANLSE